MNKQMLFDWLIDETNAKAEEWFSLLEKKKAWKNPPEDAEHLYDAIWELQNRPRPFEYPPLISSDINEALVILREFYNDNVSIISLVLNYYFPDHFCYFRINSVEYEIFEGIRFFSDIVDEFKFGHDKIGLKGIDKYLVLNQQLLAFTRKHWGTDVKAHQRLSYFLYQGIGRMFLEPMTYPSYWIMVADPVYYKTVDPFGEDEWSGRKDVRQGDFVFMYRKAPESAITDIYQISGSAHIDPWGSFNGFWVPIRHRTRIRPVTFATLRNDSKLKEWSVARRSLQGVICEPIPYRYYNRLLELIPPESYEKAGLHPEAVQTSLSGSFSSEAEFDKEVVAKLIHEWRLKPTYQYLCPTYFGNERHPLRIDYIVHDAKGPVTLFEDKVRIADDRALNAAKEQARSYALMQGIPSFIVASPEGYWIYSLEKNVPKLELKLTHEEMASKKDEVRALLLRMRR